MAQSNSDEGLPQVTLVVLGARGVGKSTFVQNSLDLRSPSTSAFEVKKMSLDEVVYLVRLVEISLGDVIITESSQIKWPTSPKGFDLPPIDGVLVLYDVTNKESITGVPDLLCWSPNFPSFCPFGQLLTIHAISRLRIPLQLRHPSDIFSPYLANKLRT
jgi:hypothetical protein